MGYTAFTIEKIESILLKLGERTKVVVDIGAQQLYNQPHLPAPYASTWYGQMQCIYTSIDISGENDAWPWDLSKHHGPALTVEDGLTPLALGGADLVVDAGTQEHIGKDGAFDWESIYNCNVTKHMLLRVGGFLLNENPKTNNWPGHGFNYFTQDFYGQLCATADYELIECGETAAMGNITNGWNVYAIIKKTGHTFPTLDQFKTFSLYTS